MENKTMNASIDDNKKIEKIDTSEIKKIKDQEELMQYIHNLKNDSVFLKNCKKYSENKNKQ